MPSRNEIARVVGEWICKAEEDLKAAVSLLKLADECPAGIVCFHAQQCVEKYLKALLSLNGIPFPKTHVLRVLASLLPPKSRPRMDAAAQDRLTEYATVTRYPGDYEPIMLPEARKAVAIARRARTEARRLLPRECLLAGRAEGLRGRGRPRLPGDA